MQDPEKLFPERDMVQGLTKGLAIIACFNADRPRLSLSQAAILVGITRAAARRSLHTLCANGYARFDGKYFYLEPKTLNLGYSYLSSSKLPTLIRPSLEQVAVRLQETSSAAILDGSDAVYVARVSRRRSMMYDIGIGTHVPAYCTSLGRVLLAQLPEDERRKRLAASHLDKRTPYTVTDIGRLMTLIDEVRRNGFALVDQELELGLRSLAIPFIDGSGNCLCAVNVSLPSARMTPQEMLEIALPKLIDARNRASYLGHVLTGD
jgi:IclR family pca regulon transcriptional regulator